MSCYVKLGWGPRLENRTGAAERFRIENHLDEWRPDGDGQLLLKAEFTSADAARVVRNFYEEVIRSHKIWTTVPIIRSYSAINIPSPWFLVATSRPWEPDGSLARCIAVEDSLLAHIGAAPPRFADSAKPGMAIWNGPEAVKPGPPHPIEDQPPTDEPLFSPEGTPPEFFELEEQ